MLNLTRGIGEAIYIGDDIKITVLENDGSEVRIGINTPQDVYILRKELVSNDQEEDVATIHTLTTP